MQRDGQKKASRTQQASHDEVMDVALDAAPVCLDSLFTIVQQVAGMFGVVESSNSACNAQNAGKTCSMTGKKKASSRRKFVHLMNVPMWSV